MRGLRSALVTVTVASMFGIGVVVGCSANGSGDAVDDTTPTDPMTGSPTAKLPAQTPVAPDPDAGKATAKDAGKDAYVDAGPPPPVPGTACPTIDEVKKKKCGACGEQETLCLGNGSDAGGGTWSAYSSCLGELTGGCIPGTVVNEACGNCGTRVKTCSQYCAFSTAACSGQPPASCVPGSVDLSGAGCANTTTFHQRTCASTCSFGNFGLTCDAAPTSITAGPTLGSVSSTIVTLTSTQVTTRLGGSCPTATLTPVATQTPYAYIKVHNPLASSIVVSIYNSLAPGGVVFPTLLASYGAATPTTDPLRKACVQGVNDFGNDSLTGDASFASLDDVYAVTIPANGTVTVYNAAQTKYSAANPTQSIGNVKLTVRTEQVN